MFYFLQCLYGLMQFKRSPADMPSSWILFALTLILSLTAGILEGRNLFIFSENVKFNLLDIGLLMLFVHLALTIRKYPSRFQQTMIALFAVNFVLRIISLPAYKAFMATDLTDPQATIPTWAFFSMLLIAFYSIAIVGHILRHALSVKLMTAIGLTLVYAVLNYLLLTLTLR